MGKKPKRVVLKSFRLQRGLDHVVEDGCAIRCATPTPYSGFNGASTTWSRMDEARAGAKAEIGASTGPRPRGRGWLIEYACGRDGDGASTGPRPRGRGWLLLRVKSSLNELLQR